MKKEDIFGKLTVCDRMESFLDEYRNYDIERHKEDPPGVIFAIYLTAYLMLNGDMPFEKGCKTEIKKIKFPENICPEVEQEE